MEITDNGLATTAPSGMTLGTFFVTAATGVITLPWDTPQKAIAVIAGSMFLIGVAMPAKHDVSEA